MEIDRAVLKKRAWTSLKGIYWFLFLVCLLAGIVGADVTSGGVSLNLGNRTTNLSGTANIGGTESFNVMDYHFESVEEFFNAFLTTERLQIFAMIVAVLFLIFILLILAFRIFISGPAEVSFAKTKLEAVINRSTDGENLLFGFRCGYKNVLKVIFVKNLYIGLWNLLPFAAVLPLSVLIMGYVLNEMFTEAIILAFVMSVAVIVLSLPATVKTYSYMMVPYIVAENPKVGARAAIKLSRNMMHGFKWQTFVLRLSFIGWYILGALCCGLGILFVEPYYQATKTLLYEELKAYYNGGGSSSDGGDEAKVVE